MYVVNDRYHTWQWPLKIIVVLKFNKLNNMWYTWFFFHLWWEQYLWGLAVGSLSQHLNSEQQITSQSATDLFSVQRSLSPQHSIFRGHYCPPWSYLMVFRVHCCRFFIEYLRSYTKSQVQRIYLNKPTSTQKPH